MYNEKQWKIFIVVDNRKRKLTGFVTVELIATIWTLLNSVATQTNNKSSLRHRQTKEKATGVVRRLSFAAYRREVKLCSLVWPGTGDDDRFVNFSPLSG
ncbi:hypothetical protein T11_4418 [Trichinella zimbabwensis]|uniref:PiggyBac transposable element-derived protein domain-containing protein n=1 Tax=Trichinella zimbabwensis TaxID=268475 RepID=A0A0V1HD45_9BILA|nr:hypothetical protein T11_4418 [Trichinella zimbabwensis]